MNFDIEIKNFGKAKHAKLQLNPFTVIAGSNSSGKSFVTRALYSFFSTINQDHITKAAIFAIIRIKSSLRSAQFNLDNPSMVILDLHKQLQESIFELESTIDKEYGECTYIEQYSRGIIVSEKLLDIESIKDALINEISGKKKYIKYLDRITMISHWLKTIKNTIDNPNKILSDSIEKGFDNALKENFQVPNLSDLKNFTSNDDEPISFDFGSLGKIQINNESIGFNLTAESINKFQSLYNVVFLESPIYWKLRKPLLQTKDRSHFFVNSSRRSSSDSLTGVPKYFYDLINLVDKNIKSNENSQDNLSLYKNITDIIGGELDLSESGDIYFNETGSNRNININLTATGVTNLGLIGLLLKKNVIAKGSFLFVDEPEVNLHPAWQKILIETLYHLSKNGINVVIASHSIDMMKYIENIMKKSSEEDITQHFAINRLSNNGISIDIEDIHPLQKLSMIKEDLGSPFYDMFLESDW